jgi:hypothetical protein
VRVAWYFYIIPQLRRWFTTQKETKLLRWHKEGQKKENGKLRHHTDATQWGNIDSHFGWFADEYWNVRFTMSTDGVNPFGNQSSTHSTWLVVLSLYNLLHWICTKPKCMMLTILVSGLNQYDDCIDVYLRPLVNDLKTVWKPGVKEVQDEFRHEELTLHAMLFTTINDNTTHRNLSGRSKRKGAACPHYLKQTCSLWLRNEKNHIYGALSVNTKKWYRRGTDLWAELVTKYHSASKNLLR